MNSQDEPLKPVISFMKSMDSRDQFSIITVGHTPQLIHQRAPLNVALDGINRLTFQASKDSISSAIEMASNLTTGQINVFSDHVIEEVDQALIVHSNGTPKQEYRYHICLVGK